MRLRDCPSPRLTWHDLHVVIRHSKPDSHLYAVMFPERAGWDLHAILAGRTVDYLALLLWAKTKAARRGYGRPKSILPFGKPAPRPGAKPKAAPLSAIRARMAALHTRRGPRHLQGPPKTREQRIKDIFD